MVAVTAPGQGIGTGLVDHTRRGAQAAGCEYPYVDFEDHLAAFYYGACGFQATSAGLLELSRGHAGRNLQPHPYRGVARRPPGWLSFA
jgi:predicted N-acetyltransferase YhbS